MLMMLLTCGSGVAADASLKTDSAGEALPVTMARGTGFQECRDCPQMIVIPAGHFTMTRKSASDGRRDDDPEGARKRRPAREVDIVNAFAMSIYPVTRLQFGVFVHETHWTVKRKGCHVQRQGVWVFDERRAGGIPGFAQTARDPVTCVSWGDAQAYLQWLNAKRRDSALGGANAEAYRLPAWEEIEYAASGGTTTLYYWGSQPRRDKANYGAEQCLPCGPKKEGADRWDYTSPVGSFPPNAFGLYDMAGNVWQWAERCSPDPNTAVAKDCRTEVLHGGSWLTNPEYLRTGEYNYADTRHRNYHIGFRVVRTLN